MDPSSKATLIRFAIPVLRWPTFYVAIYAIQVAQYVEHFEPLQKLYYARIIEVTWGWLALVPFILLRAKWVSQIYYLLSSVCLAFLAYDYFVPFRYFSPSFRGRMLRGELSNGELLRINEWSQFSTSGNDSEISFWISNPTVPGPMEILQGLM